MNQQTLQYFVYEGPSAVQFELSGEINGEGAQGLRKAWNSAGKVIGKRRLIVDMTFVTAADLAGRSLLVSWHNAGAQIIAKSKISRELAESIIGKPLADRTPERKSAMHWTWLSLVSPFGRHSVASLIVFIAALLLPIQSRAASLQAETVAAFENYLQSVNATLQERVRPGGRFLWSSEDPKRFAKVRAGEIAADSVPGPGPRRVPGGLIHHWIGAAFLPGTKLDGVLEVTNDYSRYKEFYQPSVIESKTMSRGVAEDKFYMVLMNQALFLKTAVEADYLATNAHPDDRRFYSISRTTRLQEVEDYGQASERRLPEGEGSGFIWKLFSIVRLEERDEGVYVEMEAIALSREIPGALRLIVDPIVRRVSRKSMLTSISQTETAARHASLAQATHSPSPAHAEPVSSASEFLRKKGSAFVPVE